MAVATLIVEVHDSSGNLVAILENATSIQYAISTNQVPTISFDLPADDSKRSNIAWGSEIWLRDYRTGTVVRKLRLSNVRDRR